MTKGLQKACKKSIDMALIKEVIFSFVSPLTYICNLSFQMGVFPNDMKLTKVIPIYKNGDKHSMANYRPVSLLPQFSKILEKIFVKQSDSFILNIKYNISENQYGFRENRTTTYAIMHMVEEIANASENDECSIGIHHYWRNMGYGAQLTLG